MPPVTPIRSAKCQAKDPASCIDPQCPERKAYRAALSNAKTYEEYEAAKTKQKNDLAAQQKRNLANQVRRPGVEYNRDGDPILKFHKDIGFPRNYTPPTGMRQTVYTAHAQQQRHEDRYGYIPELKSLNLNKMELIELKVNGRTKQVDRLMYRAELDDYTDICVVIRPVAKGKMLVITNWLNDKDDQHRTLRADEYVNPNVRAKVPVAA